MAAAGWLEITEGGIQLPNFEDHNGHNGKKRAQAAKRQQKKRIEDAEPSHTERDGQRDENVTREEKRREDLKPPISPPKGGTTNRKRRQTKKHKAALRGGPITETPTTGQF
jgi:hypothetical protein